MATTVTWFTKDPAEVREYEFNWTGWFTYDYIATSTWTIASGTGATPLTLSTGTYSDNITKVIASAGTTATTYIITNTITTSKGKTLKQAASLTVTTKA